MPQLAIGGSVLLTALAMWAVGILGAFGVVGAALTFVALPILLIAPTPRSWWFLALGAFVLSATPAISYAVQLLQPSGVQRQVWSAESGWTPIAGPGVVETLSTASIIGAALFAVVFSALALMKRVGVAAKNQL